ncbi:transmembrane protein 208-like [Sycon ciliatum]|uniref:transmembrane protein 208-like n=1 Tax=Sycon ciliatum TaxID=27933 RepID=UPI0020AAD340|eukprot:scpid19261/ scgid16964/ Transmembrane protein 208
MAPKQKAKGQKEIYKGNQETLKFYAAFTVVPNVIYFLVYFLFYSSSFSWLRWIGWLLSAASATAGFLMMYTSAKASFSANGQLVDAGLDLGMTEGMTEYIKDVVIFSGAVIVLGSVSGYFLLLWFVIPAFMFYHLWIQFLWPWIHGPEGGEEPMADQGRRRSRVQKVVHR